MKPNKSANELATMIMARVRKRSDWSDVLDAVILPSIGATSHQPNWKAGFTMNGPRTVPADVQQIAVDISTNLDWDEQQ